MNLEFLNRLGNQLEQNQEVQKFMSELGNFLKSTIEGNNMDIFDRVEKEKNVSLVSKNKMRNQKQEILKSYAKETMNEGDLYFVTAKRNEERTYRVEKYDSNVMEVLDLQLPQETLINSVMRDKDGEYVLDEKATKGIKEKLESMVDKVLQEQTRELEDYRQEGHLYLVTEDTNGRIYLSDQTEKRGFEIEEVDFPNEFRNDISEGTMLKYENGSYQIVS